MINLHRRTNDVTEYACGHMPTTKRSIAAATNPHHKYFKASRHMQMKLKHLCNMVDIFYPAVCIIAIKLRRYKNVLYRSSFLVLSQLCSRLYWYIHAKLTTFQKHIYKPWPLAMAKLMWLLHPLAVGYELSMVSTSSIRGFLSAIEVFWNDLHFI